jgi:trehalose 6-phosphate phosphatase
MLQNGPRRVENVCIDAPENNDTIATGALSFTKLNVQGFNKELCVTGDETARNLMHKLCVCQRPGLLTDIDGTISELVAHPEEAVVEDRAKAALSRIADRFELVGAVTGRSAEDALTLVGLENIVYSGNHGMEIWRNGKLEQSPVAARFTPKITELLDRLELPRKYPEIFIEHKGLTASIHYRNTDDPERAKELLLHEVHQLAEDLGLKITEGQMVIEVRPPVDLSKGTSVLELIEKFALDGLVYLGDDSTDVDAFRSLGELRRQTGRAFYSIGVMRDSTPPEVSEFADASVSGVSGVIDVLEACVSCER